MTDSVRGETFRPALSAVLRARRIGAGAFVVRKGAYDFPTLNNWKASATRNLLGQAGLAFVDADEAENRVRIGVTTVAARDWVWSRLSGLGIPQEAVQIVVVEPTRFLQQNINSSAEAISPLMGGIRAQVVYNTGAATSCTMGYIVRFDYPTPDPARYLVTNSHCSRVMGRLDSTTYNHPNTFPNERIGVEYLDPAYTTSATDAACPSVPAGARCRRSDALLVRLDATTHTIGLTARTQGPNLGQPASFTINSTNRYFSNGFEDTRYYVYNQVMSKVGVSTGWTTGPISNTCTNHQVTRASGEVYVFYCSYFVNGGALEGDSGSPVFEYDLASGYANPYGMVYAGNDVFWAFSTMNNIRNDLGQFVYGQ